MLDTQAVEPMASVHDTHMTGRADVVDDGGTAEAIVANAPERHDHFFAVPQAVE